MSASGTLKPLLTQALLINPEPVFFLFRGFLRLGVEIRGMIDKAGKFFPLAGKLRAQQFSYDTCFSLFPLHTKDYHIHLVLLYTGDMKSFISGLITVCHLHSPLAFPCTVSNRAVQTVDYHHRRKWRREKTQTAGDCFQPPSPLYINHLSQHAMAGMSCFGILR